MPKTTCGRKHPLPKTAYLLKVTCPSQAYYLTFELISTPIVLVQVPDQFDVFSTRKKPQKRTPKISLRLILVIFKNVRIIAAPILLKSIELWTHLTVGMQHILWAPDMKSSISHLKHDFEEIRSRTRHSYAVVLRRLYKKNTYYPAVPSLRNSSRQKRLAQKVQALPWDDSLATMAAAYAPTGSTL